MNSTEADRQAIRRVIGIYEGLLSDEERESFARCVADGYAYRDYSHPGGFMGLARVRYNP